MEMHQIRYFLATAEVLNFTKAAENCHVAQPALSRAIKMLEGELGGLLFHRDPRNIHLTKLGRMVHPHLAELYENSRSVKLMARDYTKPDKTPLRLGIMSTIAPDQFIDLIGELRSLHPGIELQLSDSDAQDLKDRLLSGELDLAIYAFPGDKRTDKTHHQHLFREQMVIVISRSHPLANQNAIRVADLNNQNYIHRNNCEFAGYADKVFAEQSVTVRPAYRSDRDDWTLAMVAAGLGFGFMPLNSAKHSAAVGALVRAAMNKKWFGEEFRPANIAAE
jgi:DNA-binding transcriptional LysR family regulator